MELFKSLFIAISSTTTLTTLGFAQPHSITLYSEPNQQGTNMTFTSKEADLRPWRPFIDFAQSYCATGVWMAYSQINYQVSQFWFENKCGNYLRFPLLNSLRFPGSSVMNETMSLFDGTFLSPWSGGEKVVENEDYSIGFNSTWIMVMGTSNWTLFSDRNFQGEGICIKKDAEDEREWYEVDTRGLAVMSVRKGCN